MDSPLRRCAAAASLALSLFAGPALADALVPWRGDPTPPLSLVDLDGRRHDLAEFRGRTVVLNFWATWCEPCRDEMPSLMRLQAKLGDARHVVLAVDVGESKERAQAFLERISVKLPVLLDGQGDTARAWRVKVYPSTYVIGPDGTIRYYYVGELDWSEPEVVKAIEAIR